MSAWADIVAGYSLVQSTSDSKPGYSATGFNGRPCLPLDGIDDYLTLASQPFPSAANPVEIWALADQTALAADNAIRALFSYGGTTFASQRRVRRRVIAAANRGNSFVNDGGEGADDTVVALSGRHVLRQKVTATGHGISVDGGAFTNVVITPTTGTTRVRLGCVANDTPAQFWQGSCAAVFITAPLTTEDASSMLAYLTTRKG